MLLSLTSLIESIQFVKFGLTSEALRSYVTLISREVEDYLDRSPRFIGERGTVDITAAMAEITIFTASRSLQGNEVRSKFDSSFAGLYHDLDMGFSGNILCEIFVRQHDDAFDA